jgi:uncharacterized membrane protein YphA (DoxX/SURF4 family)
MKRAHLLAAPWLLMLLFFALPGAARAHVKWFAEFSFDDPPLSLPEILTPLFFGMALLSFVVIGALVLVDRRLQGVGWYERIGGWLAQYKPHAETILRVGLGMTLLLAWQADSLLVPRLTIEQPLVGWGQFVCVLLLLHPRTVPLAGVGVVLLYLYGVTQYGLFYMLDYAHFLGVAFYLIFNRSADERIRGLTLPALYATLGFSLFWVGLEKLVYPGWGLYILEQNPQLALGFPPEFFLLGAAFVELSLGYLLIIGLLERPMALLITLVFFTTTLVFGEIEVIGHTLLHAVLIVFLVSGTGEVYRPPIALHRRTLLRVAFASVNFLILLAVLLIPYAGAARATYAHALAEAGAGEDNPPDLDPAATETPDDA